MTKLGNQKCISIRLWLIPKSDIRSYIAFKASEQNISASLKLDPGIAKTAPPPPQVFDDAIKILP